MLTLKRKMQAIKKKKNLNPQKNPVLWDSSEQAIKLKRVIN